MSRQNWIAGERQLDPIDITFTFVGKTEADQVQSQFGRQPGTIIVDKLANEILYLTITLHRKQVQTDGHPLDVGQVNQARAVITSAKLWTASVKGGAGSCPKNRYVGQTTLETGNEWHTPSGGAVNVSGTVHLVCNEPGGSNLQIVKFSAVLDTGIGDKLAGQVTDVSIEMGSVDSSGVVRPGPGRSRSPELVAPAEQKDERGKGWFASLFSGGKRVKRSRSRKKGRKSASRRGRKGFKQRRHRTKRAHNNKKRRPRTRGGRSKDFVGKAHTSF